MIIKNNKTNNNTNQKPRSNLTGNWQTPFVMCIPIWLYDLSSPLKGYMDTPGSLVPSQPPANNHNQQSWLASLQLQQLHRWAFNDEHLRREMSNLIREMYCWYCCCFFCFLPCCRLSWPPCCCFWSPFCSIYVSWMPRKEHINRMEGMSVIHKLPWIQGTLWLTNATAFQYFMNWMRWYCEVRASNDPNKNAQQQIALRHWIEMGSSRWD